MTSDKYVEQANHLWELRNKSRDYLVNKNFAKAVPMWVDFYEGNQWKDTKISKQLQQIKVNFIKMSVDNKVSNITSSDFKMRFISDADNISTERITKFSEFQNKEMRLNYIARKMAHDGSVKGTWITHLYYDENAIGKLGKYKGALRAETLDMLRFYVSDPQILNIQDQEWIMYETRMKIKHAKAIADKGVDKDLIKNDALETDYSDVEQNSDAYCTVLTRYFRVDGEVWFERACKGTMIHEAKPMNPRLAKEILKKRLESEKDQSNGSDDFKEPYDITETHLSDQKVEKKELIKDRYKFYLYPFELNTFVERENCIYGIGDVEGLVELQKAVNVNLALLQKQTKDLSWGKVIAKEGALGNQKFTNEPGQVIVDRSKTNGWGIKLLEGQQVPNGAFNLAQNFIDLGRMVSNSNEIIAGDLSRTLSGTAIAQTIAQNEKPIESYKKRLFESLNNIGLIEEQFYKFYYTDSPYYYTLSETEKQQYANKYGISIDSVPNTVEDYFTGSDFMDVSFTIAVETGVATQYSEALVVDMLNTLYMNGNIQKMTSDQLEQFVNLYPENLMPMKDKLMEVVKRQRQSELAQKDNQLQQLTQQNIQLTAEVEQSKQSVEYLKNYIKSLTNEYSEKIEMANDKITSMEKQLKNIVIKA